MEKRSISFTFTAPYVEIGESRQHIRNLWIIFHGYGQLAEEFAGRFNPLATNENLLIFPQGLSKFYLKGIDKKSGASWMTAHDREYDIENYLNYLNSVYLTASTECPADVRLWILGFSQGAHTATRWIYRKNIRYHQLILWGAGLAEEIDKTIAGSHFNGGKNVLVVGDTDRYISKETLRGMQRKYERIGFEYDLAPYAGGHDIFPEILSKLI